MCVPLQLLFEHIWFTACNLAVVSVCAVRMDILYTSTLSQRSLMENWVVIGLAAQVVL